MGQFNKAIVALIMAVVVIVQRIWHVDLGLDEDTVTLIVTGLTPVLVYLVPNLPGTSTVATTLKTPAVVTFAAFGLALVIFGGALAGCASLSVGSGASVDQRVQAARQDVATANLFISLYGTFPECGAGVSQPCHNANALDLLQRGSKAAGDALDAVQDLINAGSPEAQILIALQHAQQLTAGLMNLRGNAGQTAPEALQKSEPPAAGMRKASGQMIKPALTLPATSQGLRSYCRRGLYGGFGAEWQAVFVWCGRLGCRYSKSAYRAQHPSGFCWRTTGASALHPRQAASVWYHAAISRDRPCLGEDTPSPRLSRYAEDPGELATISSRQFRCRIAGRPPGRRRLPHPQGDRKHQPYLLK